MPVPPWLVNLNTTARCPCHCRFCDIPKRPVREMPSAAWLDAIDQLAGWLPAGSRVVFAGGEPLARRDLPSFVERATSRGLSVNVATNGWFLEGETLARLRALPHDLSVSVHGFRRTHDALTRAPGLFARIENAFAALADAPRVGLHVTTVISGANLGEVVALARYFVEQSWIRAVYFQARVQNLGAPARPDWHRDDALWPRDAGRAARVLDELIAMKARGAKIANAFSQLEFWKAYFRAPDEAFRDADCPVGANNLTVLPDGKVQLCDHYPPLGNLADAPLRALWEGRAAEELRRAMAACRFPCNYFVNCARDDRRPEPGGGA